MRDDIFIIKPTEQRLWVLVVCNSRSKKKKYKYTPIDAKGHIRKTTEDNTRSAKQGRSSRFLEKKMVCTRGKRFCLNSGQIHRNSGYFL